MKAASTLTPPDLSLALLTCFLFSITAGFCTFKVSLCTQAGDTMLCVQPCVTGGHPGLGSARAEKNYSMRGRAPDPSPTPPAPLLPPHKGKQLCSPVPSRPLHFLAADSVALAQTPCSRVRGCPPAGLMLPGDKPSLGGGLVLAPGRSAAPRSKSGPEAVPRLGPPGPWAGRSHGPVQRGARVTGTAVPLWLEVGGSPQ